MASVFTYDPDPPRVSSPWSNSGTSTPQTTAGQPKGSLTRSRDELSTELSPSNQLADYGISKLDPEPQEGPTEYKLHLLLRPRRLYTTISTGHLVAGTYHSRLNHAYLSPAASTSPDVTSRLSQTPSATSRRQRLHSLTTQLLWRLQQSSPFHSSTTASLVLPTLPEATPRLGKPQMPTRLLPGLEESQGALYEIGVADDGTFVGLTSDELDESLNNLRTMAASLGCKVEILRKVVVGTCEWVAEGQSEDNGGPKVNSEDLCVAEALISPDLEYYNTSSGAEHIPDEPLDGVRNGQNEQLIFESGCCNTEQVRISIAGPSGAGKSSLLGTLSTSALDNGRGKSRLSLLKHRHEISSGVTSSVAQELVGYTSSSTLTSTAFDVVNYASGNVTAWTDIHAASERGRLAFLSDLPGLTRYVKSTMRGLISWAPHYVLLCIPANCSDPDAAQDLGDQIPDINICLAYLKLCIKLEIPLLIAITKLDLASRSNLKGTLSKILSAVKLSQKKPIMLSVASDNVDHLSLQSVSNNDSDEVLRVIGSAGQDSSNSIPILLTSAVTGSGIGKLHALLRLLPIPNGPVARALDHSLLRSHHHEPASDLFDVDEVFAIPPSKVYTSSEMQTKTENQGVVLCGLMRRGNISIGDELVLGPIISEVTGGSPRNRPYKPRHTSGDFSPSLIQDSIALKSRSHVHAEWQRVRVVSVRNLRLSVRTLLQDQVGTVGVEPIVGNDQRNTTVRALGRMRKGLVLTSERVGNRRASGDSIAPLLPPSRGFVAKFPGSEFNSSTSPPLILGGNAVIYIASIRAAAKVVCVALDDDDNEGVVSTPPSPTGSDLFNFDDDDDNADHGSRKYGNSSLHHNNHHQQGQYHPHESRPPNDNKSISLDSISPISAVKITFRFLYSLETIEVGSLVLVMPGASNSTTSSSGETVSFSGLEGFVGRVCEVVPSADDHI